MKILVTGGAGFIGSFFIRLCLKFDQYYNNKILNSFSPTGYLKKIKK